MLGNASSLATFMRKETLHMDTPHSDNKDRSYSPEKEVLSTAINVINSSEAYLD